MPCVLLNRNELFEAIGKSYTDEEFEDLCFEFGIELDDITSERTIFEKERGIAGANLSDEVLYKIDIPANRYDLLCLEGISRALRIFKNLAEPVEYTAVEPANNKRLKMIVKPNAAKIRPFIVCAVLRDINFTETSFKSFIELQQKLHQNVCRKRTLASIGTHDLDSTTGNVFYYDACDPKDIRFVPLKGDGSAGSQSNTKEVNGHELMELYKNHPQLKQYLDIIQSSPVYPVVRNEQGEVMSLPPIINSDYSKISVNTKNIFVECTGTDWTKTNIALNTLVSMFSQYCKIPFTVEKVDVVYEKDDNKVITTPSLENTKMSCSLRYITSVAGITHLENKKALDLLKKMGFLIDQSGQQSDDKDLISVFVPPTRTDILHACDIAEDLAIAYGYDNINNQKIPTPNCTKENELQRLTNFVRHELAQCNYDEVLTWALLSHNENEVWMNREEASAISTFDKKKIPVGKLSPFEGNVKFEFNPFVKSVKLTDPKSKEFEVVRTNLLSGLLMTLSVNKSLSLPIRLFEVSDVVIEDATNEVGASNVRRVCALVADKESSFENIHGLLDNILIKLGVNTIEYQHKLSKCSYHLIPSTDPAFLNNCQAAIILEGVCIGVMGVVNPVLNLNFDHILYPICAFEFNLEPLLHFLELDL